MRTMNCDTRWSSFVSLEKLTSHARSSSHLLYRKWEIKALFILCYIPWHGRLCCNGIPSTEWSSWKSTCWPPWNQRCHLLSDGCAIQYKNQKNLFNLSQHCSEFGIDAKWVFFATSHGKQPVDGETVKRLTRLASLGRATGDQIVTPTAMFNFCKDPFEGINFIYLSKDEVDATKAEFAKRFDNIKVIPRTRSLHNLCQ